MPASKSQQKALNKYIRNNYDKFEVLVPKGQKVFIKENAKAANESLNAFAAKAILMCIGLTE